MKATSPRQRSIRRAMTALVPLAPYSECMTIFEAAKARHMRSLAPVDAVFLATVAHIRHRQTDYDALLEEGYDQEAARYFVAEEINAVLKEWGASRGIDTF